MIPKAGDIVKLNPDFLRVWFDRGNVYFGEEVLEENLTILRIEKFLEHSIRINFKSKYFKYCLDILPNGELSSYKDYKGIQVFIN